MDQEKGSPAAVQESPYHSTLIPGTSPSNQIPIELLLGRIGLCAAFGCILLAS
jgi:hypothetical protein